MPKILISHKKEYGTQWSPFDGKDERDIKKMMEDGWKNYIKGSVAYIVAKKILECEDSDIVCECQYPSKLRPINRELILSALFDGCIFDLDAYYEDKVDYLKIEVESLPDKVYAGAISKKLEEFTNKPKVANLHTKPIYTESDLIIYLLCILTHVCAKYKEEFAKTAKITISNEIAAISKHSRKS